MDVKYEVVFGKKVPIVERLYIDDPVSCPYCLREHYHGTHDGYNITHCPRIGPKRRVHVDDEAIDYTNGYVIVTQNAMEKRPAKLVRAKRKK